MRQTLTEGVAQLLAARLDGTDRSEALARLAGMIGALVFARASNGVDAGLATETLGRCAGLEAGGLSGALDA